MAKTASRKKQRNLFMVSPKKYCPAGPKGVIATSVSSGGWKGKENLCGGHLKVTKRDLSADFV
jgi:hypothetical protein